MVVNMQRSPQRYSNQFPRGHLIQSDARQVALNVYAYLRESGKGIDASMTLTAKMTRISTKTLYLFKKEIDEAQRLKLTLAAEKAKQEGGDTVDTVSTLVDMDTGGLTTITEANSMGTTVIGASTTSNAITTTTAPSTTKKPVKTKKTKLPPLPISPRVLGKRRKGNAVKPRSRIEKYDEHTLNSIRMIVHDFQRKNIIPTALDILLIVNENDALPNFQIRTFQRLLKDLGFSFPKRKRKQNPTDPNRPGLSGHNTNNNNNNPNNNPPSHQHPNHGHPVNHGHPPNHGHPHHHAPTHHPSPHVPPPHGHVPLGLPPNLGHPQHHPGNHPSGNNPCYH